MDFDRAIKEIEILIKQHETSVDFCETAYQEGISAGDTEAHRWRSTRKYFSEKSAILHDIKDLIQEYLDVEPR